MPDWMHGGDTHRIVHTLLNASHFLGQDNMFQRFSLDGGRVILVNGYSITTYQEALTADDLSKIEYTWSRNPDDTLIYENVRPPVRVVGHRKIKWDLEGNQRKSPYYLDEVRDVDMVNGRATFVYRNDRSSRITIHWEEWQQRQS